MSQEKIAKITGGIVMIVFGGFFFAVGAFVSAIGFEARIVNDIKLTMSSEMTKGVLVDFAETNASVNEEDVVEFIYEYETPEKERITSYSYSTTGYYLNIGDTVNVEYSPSNHYLSRIYGMNTTKLGFFSFFILIFPGVGLGIMVGGVINIVKSRKY